MNPGKLTLAAIAASTVVVSAIAQAPSSSDKPSFEVASVKANKSGDNRVMINTQPGGGLVTTNFPLRGLITWAYELQDFQLVGAPDWIDNERFDIVAKATVDRPPAPATSPAGPATRLMMQALLGERFKLTTHPDTRQLPIYSLVLARPDGKPGPQLRPATTDCDAMRGRGRGPGGPPAPSGPGDRPQCGMAMGPGRVIAGGTPMSRLITPLSQAVRRVVIDRTNLKGNFDIDLVWTPDQMPGPPPPGVTMPAIDPNGPSIFTALQEQLGLKLESQTGPVEVLVIDHVERPSEN